MNEAMRPVSVAIDVGESVDENQKFERYLKNFEPEKVQVIQYRKKDVGRLRIVRSSESIYVGGIQILPTFQGKKIGDAIFMDLIEESNLNGIPILLEVHLVNTKAMKFYKARGFKEVERNSKQAVMQYTPTNS